MNALPAELLPAKRSAGVAPEDDVPGVSLTPQKGLVSYI